MSKNKLYTQSYFVKRVLEFGYDVKRLNIQFENDDPRQWMIIVNSKRVKYRNNICITCFKNPDRTFSFKFQGQKERDLTLSTQSMEIIRGLLDNTIGEVERKVGESDVHAVEVQGDGKEAGPDAETAEEHAG